MDDRLEEEVADWLIELKVEWCWKYKARAHGCRRYDHETKELDRAIRLWKEKALCARVEASLRVAPRVKVYTKPTPRQITVLRLMARGLRDAEIAAHLGVSVRTVQGHAREVFDSLGVKSRMMAVMVAARRGYIGGKPKKESDVNELEALKKEVQDLKERVWRLENGIRLPKPCPTSYRLNRSDSEYGWEYAEAFDELKAKQEESHSVPRD